MPTGVGQCQESASVGKRFQRPAGKRLSNDVQALRVQVENLKEREAALAKDLERVSDAKDQLWHDAAKRYDEIKAERDSARNESEERGESLKLANRRNQNLQNKNETLVRERESHMAEFDQRGTDLANAHKRLRENEIEHNKERSRLEDEVNTARHERDSARKRLREKNEHFEVARKEANARIDDLVEQNELVGNDLAAALATNTAITEKAQAELDKCNEAQKRLQKAYDAAVADKQDMIAERDDWKVRAEDAIGERDTFKAERDNFAQVIAEKDEEIEKVGEMLYDAEAERDASQNALSEKLDQLSEATKEVEALKTTLANTQSDYDRLNKDYKAIEAKIETVKGHNAKLSDNLKTARAKIKVLNDDMEQAEADYKSLSGNYDEQGKELEGMHERLDEANSNLSTLGEQYNDRGKDLEAAQAKLARQKEIASTQKERADELSEQVAEKASEIRRLEAVVADLNQTIKRKNADIASTSAWRDDLQQKLDAANATVRSLKTTLNTRKDELAECRKLHTTAMKEIDNLEKNIAKHQANIAGLESDYEKPREQISGNGRGARYRKARLQCRRGYACKGQDGTCRGQRNHCLPQ